MMTDFDFAGFLDTDNQKNFVISLIKLFDSIILEENEEKILHNISEVKKIDKQRFWWTSFSIK